MHPRERLMVRLPPRWVSPPYKTEQQHVNFRCLRTGHYRGMKFYRKGRRSCRNCDNCLDTELTPAHIFDCPAILGALPKKRGSLRQQCGVDAYVENIEENARTVI
ncbi:hypothetical protein TNCV_4970811 [Trichonephila clavipes]|nr:hypothetical protein TNCV_4970811 [Trichonephila clavipes]